MASIYRNVTSALGMVGIFALATTLTQAAEIVNYSWTGDGGYSATGSFVFDPATTPSSFSEAPGAGPTSYVQSFNVSFFDPQHNLLETSSSIVNSVSSDSFFRLDFNTQTDTITALDADVGGTNYLYFLTNLRTPGGQVVGPGVTGFNLFVRTTGTPNLDSASDVKVTSISQTPEPTTFGLLGIAGCIAACAFAMRRKVTKQP